MWLPSHISSDISLYKRTSTVVHVLGGWITSDCQLWTNSVQRKKSESIIWFCEECDWTLCQVHHFKPTVSLPPGLKWYFRDSGCFPHIHPPISAVTLQQQQMSWRWFKFNCSKCLEEGFTKACFCVHMVNKNMNNSMHQRVVCSQGQSGRLGWLWNWQGW